MKKGFKLEFTAILAPEDYGPVMRSMIIGWNTPEELEWLKNYRFPGPVQERFVSDKAGYPDPMGKYYHVVPVTGPDIAWTMAFHWNEPMERNEYRNLGLPGLVCRNTVCPALKLFTQRRPYTRLKNDMGYEVRFQYMDYLPPQYQTGRSVRKELKGTLPLIIWLHGAGEGGNKPSIAVLGNRVTALAEETVQMYFPETGAAVLVPQCPTMWMDIDGKCHYNDAYPDSDGRSFYTSALVEMIRRYVRYHPQIDRNRIYIGGCSNGGFMTLQLLLAMPGVFAAAYPCCPAYHASWMNAERIRTLAKTPIWVTAAATDQTLPLKAKDGSPNHADALVQKLRAASGNVVYTRLPQVMGFDSKGFPYEYNGHFSWIPLLQDRITKEFDGEEIHLFEWLASQRKSGSK